MSQEFGQITGLGLTLMPMFALTGARPVAVDMETECPPTVQGGALVDPRVAGKSHHYLPVMILTGRQFVACKSSMIKKC